MTNNTWGLFVVADCGCCAEKLLSRRNCFSEWKSLANQLAVTDPKKMLTGGMSFEWGHFFSKFANSSRSLYPYNCHYITIRNIVI
jgi:hypothetical protein